MKLYEIPGLFCPYSSGRLSPAIETINAHLRSWMIKFKLVSSNDQLEFYMAQNYATMIAISYPYADQNVMAAWCDLNTLLFCLDDIMDEQTAISTIEKMNELETSFLNIIDEAEPILNTPVLDAFADFWNRFKPYCSSAQQEGFKRDIEQMFYGGKWQFHSLKSNHSPSYQEYLSLRGYLGAAHLATNSLPITADIPFTPEMYSNKPLKALNDQAQNLICIANDLFSYGKEAEKSFGGAQFNIVTVLSNEHNLSVENAIKEAAAIHDEKMNEFMTTADRLKQNPDFNILQEKYVNALGALMAGNIIWSTRYSNRYPHIYLG